jgi:hypothetical protein
MSSEVFLSPDTDFRKFEWCLNKAGDSLFYRTDPVSSRWHYKSCGMLTLKLAWTEDTLVSCGNIVDNLNISHQKDWEKLKQTDFSTPNE